MNNNSPKHAGKNSRNFFVLLAVILVAGAAAIALMQNAGKKSGKSSESRTTSVRKKSSSHSNAFSKSKKKKKSRTEKKVKSRITAKSDDKKSVMRTPIDWQKSSETVAYPDLNTVQNLWIEVRLRTNRTVLMDGDKVIYTMYSSGGMYHDVDGKEVSYTPTGTYYVENERGETFFNNALNEGANYWISWLNHGEYLFHTVPIDANGNYEVDECKKLGKQPASHGCIRLSVPDAVYLYDNLPVGTKIVIGDN